jgi:hypothetical protein
MLQNVPQRSIMSIAEPYVKGIGLQMLKANVKAVLQCSR